MPYQLPPEPGEERRARRTRWVSFAFAAALVALVTYFAYIGYEGSRQLTDPPVASRDCRTPVMLGWSYEAINYDIAADAELAAQPDPTTCSRQGAAAGDAVTAGDVGLAGWYIPAGNGAGPEAPTVVLAHGWGSNKSEMLDRAAVLHDGYNLLLFDQRNHGQSGDAPTTVGVREATDLRAMIDWIEASKGADAIAVLGVSMGGATVLAEASRDDRVDAIIVESTYTTVANAAQVRLEQAGYPLAVPGSWAILFASLLRTGEDVSSADPVQDVGRLDGRPLLVIHAGADATIDADDDAELATAAQNAGTPTERMACADAGHGQAIEACREEYAARVLGFLERALAAAS